ncbi:MAG: Rid family detoxifying hydrolase [Candidatus Micrarchaeota archaeon]|nr:Rid family detoxifying hydrolase [Candidatus Micrarchaeota archaeon]
MDIKKITAADAPKPVGPYSQAILAGKFVLCSGQIGINPKTGTLVEGGVENETDQTMKNITAILSEAGAGLEDVVKTEIYLSDINDYKKFNDVYSKYFNTDPQPARQTAGVSALPKGAKVEISCTAYLD